MLITLVIWSSGISVFVTSIWCTGCVTSRTICRSSKPQARLSRVTGTEPSSAFSMATMPERHLAVLDGLEDVADGGIGEGVQAAVGHVGEKRFFGERALGAQEGHLVAASCHAGYLLRSLVRSYPLGYQTTQAARGSGGR